MKWSFRHYGNKDTIPVKHVKQIPGVKGVVGTLLGKLPGMVWEIDEIMELKNSFTQEGMELYGIESVAIHDAIKAATDERDFYIENYKQTLRNLSACGIHLVCYSFKPVFGWTKTDLNFENEDGSKSLLYDDAVLQQMNPRDMYKLIKGQSNGFQLSGWEEDRLQKIDRLMELYADVTEEDLFANLKYFLEAVIPVCEEVDVKLGIHPDDPPWENFGLPKITRNLDDCRRILAAVDSPYNGITLCTGAFGADPNNNMAEFVYEIGNRINFVHFRNVEFLGYRKFKEVAHYSPEGSLDMFAIMKALIDVGYDGVIRPDHGRMIWDEVAIPGYGLYDRALGIIYMQGLHESITKMNELSKTKELVGTN
ncbi:MAG: mannonate dehydratase [Streptococcaceae bacterium]|jgi:mannonate dehydratase|nr:mannonate dehydratase [Streptococcaceae bacterium]